MDRKPFRRSVPSLTALVALDAAVRHRNFTRAGQEMGITQTAVSRHIQCLEEDFGVQLFHRRHRAIEPTELCLKLGAALSRHFRGISDSISDFRAASAEVPITIGATSAFSQLWLLPRVLKFREEFPDARIRVQTTDDPIDLDAGECDLAIRYGEEPFQDGRVAASRSDFLFPVCSPRYAAKLANVRSDVWIDAYELIGTVSSQKSWYDWNDWFRATGLAHRARPAALTFNHFTASLYSARAGQGVALGWELLVQTFLEDGTLIKLGDRHMKAGGKFHIVVSNRARTSPMLDTFVAWLSGQLETASSNIANVSDSSAPETELV